MKKILFISLITLIIVSGMLLAQVNNKITIDNRWKAVEELTISLQVFDKKDPVKYDFALFGAGVNGLLK